jgi:hypothetical protein
MYTPESSTESYDAEQSSTAVMSSGEHSALLHKTYSTHLGKPVCSVLTLVVVQAVASVIDAILIYA